MSYHTWSVDGYGICTNEIETTVDRIEELLKHAPIFSKKLHDDFIEMEIDEPNIQDYLEYDCDYYSGIAYLIKEVIQEAEREKNLTKEEFNKIFKKYINILTDNKLVIDYQSVENGG